MKPKKKLVNFDFFCCSAISSNSTDTIPVSEILTRFVDEYKNRSLSSKRIGLNIYEIRHIEKTSYGFKGVIGKHRKDDLPHVAEIGGVERALKISSKENLLEKSYFAFYKDYSIMILQRNRFCINYANMGKFLSEDGVLSVELAPVILPTSLKLLLDNHVYIRYLTLSIAKPTNPDLFKGKYEYDFSNSIRESVKYSGSAKFDLTLRGNGRSEIKDNRYLPSTIKGAVLELLNKFEVDKCQLKLEDDNGINHPIDLIVDRLIYTKEISLYDRYPAEIEVWEALEEARSQKEDDLISYFGSLNKLRLK